MCGSDRRGETTHDGSVECTLVVWLGESTVSPSGNRDELHLGVGQLTRNLGNIGAVSELVRLTHVQEHLGFDETEVVEWSDVLSVVFLVLLVTSVVVLGEVWSLSVLGNQLGKVDQALSAETSRGGVFSQTIPVVVDGVWVRIGQPIEVALLLRAFFLVFCDEVWIEIALAKAEVVQMEEVDCRLEGVLELLSELKRSNLGVGQEEDWSEGVEGLKIRGNLWISLLVGQGCEHLGGSLTVTHISDLLGTGHFSDLFEVGWLIILSHLLETPSPEGFLPWFEADMFSRESVTSVVSEPHVISSVSQNESEGVGWAIGHPGER